MGLTQGTQIIRENAVFPNLKSSCCCCCCCCYFTRPGLDCPTLFRQRFSRAQFFGEYLWTSQIRSVPNGQAVPEQQNGGSCQASLSHFHRFTGKVKTTPHGFRKCIIYTDSNARSACLNSKCPQSQDDTKPEGPEDTSDALLCHQGANSRLQLNSSLV